MTPERIYAGLTKPSHTTEAETGVQALSDVQRRRVAEFMSGRPMGSMNAGEAKAMPNQCTSNPAMTDPTRGASWNGWGNDLANTRFQPAAAARLTAADVSKLKVKWSFGFPKGETNNSQPTVVSGRVFVGGDNGYIYSLDAKTGCVYWSYQQGSIVRGGPIVGRVTGQGETRWAVFFGDGHALPGGLRGIGVGLPDVQHVELPADRAPRAPQGQKRNRHLAAVLQVLLVVLQID